MLFAVVAAEFRFPDAEGKPPGSDSVMFHEVLLGPTLEDFEAVDSDTPAGEVPGVGDLEVAAAPGHEAIVDLEAIGVDEMPPRQTLLAARSKTVRAWLSGRASTST